LHTIYAEYVKQNITNLYVVAYIYAPTLEATEPRVHVLGIGLGEGPAINSARLHRLLQKEKKEQSEGVF
jgi:hypothetical protein